MQILGLMAIGFVIGALVTMFFGRKIAAAAVADAKAVAFDAGRVMSDALRMTRNVVAQMEARMHAKLDTLKTGAVKEVEKL